MPFRRVHLSILLHQNKSILKRTMFRANIPSINVFEKLQGASAHQDISTSEFVLRIELGMVEVGWCGHVLVTLPQSCSLCYLYQQIRSLFVRVLLSSFTSKRGMCASTPIAYCFTQAHPC